MNNSALVLENVQNIQESNAVVSALSFLRTDKFDNIMQKEAYRKKALREIRKALKSTKEF
ncbi:MAG: hypothetical protein JXR07_16360 [Reichenbachiella sp.]